MHISDSVAAIINNQIREEFESAYLYLSMSAWFEGQDLPGFARWLKIQYKEELGHGEKMFDYLVARDSVPEVSALKKPTASWQSPLAAFEAAYAHEQHITAAIYKIVELARKEGDFATDEFYTWFVREQVEEESNAITIVKELKMIGESKTSLYMLDRRVAKRGE